MPFLSLTPRYRAAAGPGATLDDAVMWHTMGQFDNGATLYDDTDINVGRGAANDLQTAPFSAAPNFTASTPTGGPALTAQYAQASFQASIVAPNIGGITPGGPLGTDMTDYSWACAARSDTPSPVPAFPKAFHGVFDNSLPTSLANYYFGVQRLAGVDELVWGIWDAVPAGIGILGGAVAQGSWHYYVGTWRSSDGLFVLYKDGVSVGSNNITTFPAGRFQVTPSVAYIKGGSYSDMRMCNFGWWHRMITPTEIAYLAGGGMPNLANAL